MRGLYHPFFVCLLSLFAQYVSGTKKPSKQRFDEIIETIREIGRELMTVPA